MIDIVASQNLQWSCDDSFPIFRPEEEDAKNRSQFFRAQIWVPNYLAPNFIYVKTIANILDFKKFQQTAF